MRETKTNGIWISRIISPGRWIKQPLLRGWLVFGLPIDILMGTFLLLRWAAIPRQFFIPYILCVLWLSFGPCLIWYYDCKLLPSFFEKLGGLILHGTKTEMEKKYKSLFARKFWIFPIPWTLLFIILAFQNGFVLDLAGTQGPEDPWRWLLLLVIIWIGFLLGVGTWGVMVTLMATNHLANQEMVLDPLHPDKHGGIGFVGIYAIGTTLLIASGSFFLPMVFQLGIESNSRLLMAGIYGGVGIYILVILASFIYPTFRIRTGARKYIESKMEELRGRHNSLTQKQTGKSDDHLFLLTSHLQVAQLRREFDDYKNLKLYPLEVDTLAKLTSSVVLPVLLILLQSFFFM